jgi:hypothetical protein
MDKVEKVEKVEQVKEGGKVERGTVVKVEKKE